MKKILLFILIILILSAAGGLYYFNAVFLPSFLQKTIQEKGRDLINREISYDDIEYRIGRGLLIKNLKISQKDHPDKAFFQAKEISSEIPIMPLLKEKKIILPQISVRGFSGSIFRMEENAWNFTDLLSLKKQGTEGSFEILLGKIVLDQGQISITDMTQAFDPTMISITHIQAGLSLPDGVTFSLAGEVPNDQTKFSFKGSYSITQKSVTLEGQAANIDLIKKIFPFIPNTPSLDQLFIKHADVKLSWQNHVLECQGDIAADIHASLPDSGFSGHGSIESRGARLRIENNLLSLDLKNILINETSLQAGKMLQFSGQIAADNLQFTKEKKTLFDTTENVYFTLSADAAVRPNTLKIHDLSVSTEEILLTGLSFKKSPYDLTLETALLSETFTLAQKDLGISGSLSIPSMQVSMEKDIWTILAPLSLKNVSAEIQNILTAKTDLDMDSLSITLAKNYFDIIGTAKGSAASFDLPNTLSGKFLPENVSFKIIQNTVDQPEFRYEIKTTIQDGYVSQTIPEIGELSDIEGQLSIINNTITLNNLWVTAKKTMAHITGDIRIFSQWIADMSIIAEDVRIQDWIALAKDALEPYGLNLDGTTDVTVAIRGPLTIPDQLKFSVDAKIINADISSSKYPYTFQDVAGSLKYEEDFLLWDNITFQYQKKSYQTGGSLRHFKAPVISVKINSADLALFVSAEYLGDTLEILRADLKSKLSTLSGSGKIKPDKNAPYTEAVIDGYIVLSDLEQLHPTIKEKITEWDIRGRGNVSLNYIGILTDPLNARFSLTYQSDRTSVKNFRFDNLTVKTTQPNPYENVFDIGTLFHDGKVVISGNIQFQKDFPFKAQFNLAGVNLAKLKNDLPIKDQKIEGLLTAQMFLQGNAKKTDSLIGQGDIKIEQGYFVKPNFLKGIVSLILTQEYQGVVFTDAKSKLFIRENRLRLADVFIKSSAVDLTGYGWIDIDKNIDFHITPSFRIPSSMKTDLIKSSTKNVIEKYFSIRATGTLMKPKYSTQIDPAAVVQDAATMIGDGVQNLFKDLGGF